MDIIKQHKYNENIKRLYNLVFGNIYLSRLINKYVVLFRLNLNISFINRNSLIQYQEREFINKITYWGKDKLNVGDLPLNNNGVLKHVKFNRFENNQINNNGQIIPDGVEILEFEYVKYFSDFLKNDIYTPFSTLPSSINTIENAVISIKDININPNITSLSIKNLLSISFNKDNNCHFKIPNTIKSLKFINEHWDNGYKELVKGDIPEGVTELSLSRYRLHLLHTSDILPISIKKLSIEYGDHNIKDDTGLFNFIINMNIETLVILNQNYHFTPNSNLHKCNSIKYIKFKFGYYSFLPYSLPFKNLTNLTITNLTSNFKFQIGVFPECVTNLNLTFCDLYFEPPDNFKESMPKNVTFLSLNKTFNNDVLPHSITHLDLNGQHVGRYLKSNILIMVSNLPNLTQVNVPLCFEDLKLTLHKYSIKKNYINQ